LKRKIPILVFLILMAGQARAMEYKPLLYSLLVPGLGEWSLGYKTRAVSHWAFETACWTGNFYYRDKGFDLRRDYHAFADKHWSTARWASSWNESLASAQGRYPDEDPEWLSWITAEQWDSDWEMQDTAVIFEDDNPGYLHSHFAPFHEDQQHYYENLGKYDWYRWGWDDYDGGTDTSVNRFTYVGMRNKSNDYFDLAQNLISAMVIARIVSMMDTFIILKRAEMSGQSPHRSQERDWHLKFTPATQYIDGFRVALTRSW
jgi:hypothetical protein